MICRLNISLGIEEINRAVTVRRTITAQDQHDLFSQLRQLVIEQAGVVAEGMVPFFKGRARKRGRAEAEKLLGGKSDFELCVAFAEEWNDDVPAKPKIEGFSTPEEFLAIADRLGIITGWVRTEVGERG